MANLLSDPLVAEAIGLRIRAKRLEDEAKQLKELADITLIPSMIAAKVKKIEHELGDFIYTPPGKTSKLNKDKLKMYLVEKGVAAAVITAAFNVAISSSPKKEYITFKRWGEKERGEDE